MPVRVTSGFRCTAHNRAVGGKPGSIHLLGKAADVVALKVKPSTVAFAAESIRAFANGGLGRYDTFTHVDVRGYRSRWES
jgi:zinc D-Ala-D-Ala carboxypeptidase